MGCRAVLPLQTLQPSFLQPIANYEDLYEPWKDDDEFSGYIANLRLRLRNGVVAHAAQLGNGVEQQLLDVCDRIDLIFMYPIVYSVDVDTIASSRLNVSGSGSVGSKEYRVDALIEAEFDVLFIDFETENVPKSFRDLWSGSLSQADVLSIFSTWII